MSHRRKYTPQEAVANAYGYNPAEQTLAVGCNAKFGIQIDEGAVIFDYTMSTDYLPPDATALEWERSAYLLVRLLAHTLGLAHIGQGDMRAREGFPPFDWKFDPDAQRLEVRYG